MSLLIFNSALRETNAQLRTLAGSAQTFAIPSLFGGGAAPGAESAAGASPDASPVDSEALDELTRTEEELRKTMAAASSRVDEQSKRVEEMSQNVEKLQDGVTAATDALDVMAEKAGVTDTSGAGASVKALSDQLRDAREQLQYLQDTGRSAVDIDAQKATIEALTKKSEEAQRVLRIAQHEFTHSAAYEEQQRVIAAEKASVEQARKLLAAERETLDKLKASVSDDSDRLDALADVRRKKEEALAAKRQAAEEGALADAETVVAGHVTLLNGIAAMNTHALTVAAEQVAARSTEAVEKMGEASKGFEESAGQAADRVDDAYQRLRDLVDEMGDGSIGNISRDGGQSVSPELALGWVDSIVAAMNQRGNASKGFDLNDLRRAFLEFFGTKYGPFDTLVQQARARQRGVHLPKAKSFARPATSLSTLSTTGSITP